MSDATPPADVSAKPSRRFCRLRIAVSVFFAVLTIALCVLWVTSYYYESYLQRGTGSAVLQLQSAYGRLKASKIAPPLSDKLNRDWEMLIEPASAARQLPTPTLGIGWFSNQFMTSIFLPFWLLAIVCITLTAAPWPCYRNQFSLRTMLIAMTLFAVVLGLVCYIVR